MKITSVILLSSLVVADVSNLYGKWTANDLQQYLKDQKGQLQDASEESIQNLREAATDLWNAKTQPKPWWKFWENDKQSSLSRFSASDSPISDWFFDTWTSDELRKLLSRTKVSYNSKLSRDKLAEIAKKNFDKVSSKLGNSGLYPSESYFSDWDEKDIKGWLDSYGISYDKAHAKKDELLRAVRENIYAASQYAEDERVNILESVDLSNQQIADKAGKLRDEIFDSWSTKDITDWLKSHQIQIAEKSAANRDYLLDLAKENKDLLKDDIDWYLEVAKKKASPYVSKSESAVASIWEKTMGKINSIKDKFYKSDNIVNHTFLIGVENWPKRKLKAFLDSRGVSYSIFSTRADLLEMVKEYKDKPLKRIADSPAVSEFLDAWSYENVKNWVKDKNDEITSSEAYKSASRKVNELLEKAHHHGVKGASYAQAKGAKAASQAVSYAQDKGADAASYAEDKGTDALSYAKEKGAVAASYAASYAQEKGSDAASYAQDKSEDAATYIKEKGTDAWSYAQEKGSDAASYAQDKGTKAASSAASYAQEKGSEATKAVAQTLSQQYDEWTELFQSWSTDDLKRYVKSFGIKTSPTSTREKLLQQAKDNTLWFFGRYEEPFYKRVPKKIRNLMTDSYSIVFHH